MRWALRFRWSILLHPNKNSPGLFDQGYFFPNVRSYRLHSRWYKEVIALHNSGGFTILILLLSTIVITSCELVKHYLRTKDLIREQQASKLRSMKKQYSQLILHPMAHSYFLITYQGPVRQGKDIWIELNLQFGFDSELRDKLMSFRQDELKYLGALDAFLNTFQEELTAYMPDCIVELNRIHDLPRYTIDFANLHPSKKSRPFQECYTYEELERNLKSPLYDTIKEYWAERERRKLKTTKKRTLKKSAQCTCAMCHAVLKPGELTIDHIIPVSKWGRSEPWNLQVLCNKCNKSKKDVTPDNWKDLVGDHVNSIEDIEPHWIV